MDAHISLDELMPEADNSTSFVSNEIPFPGNLPPPETSAAKRSQRLRRRHVSHLRSRGQAKSQMSGNAQTPTYPGLLLSVNSDRTPRPTRRPSCCSHR